MKILIFPNAADVARYTALAVCKQVRSHPSSVLGLATGGTMEPVYELLASPDPEYHADFGQVQSFNLDEYVGLPGSHECSYRHYMKNKLFAHINIQAENAHLPRGDAEDPIVEAKEYDSLIAKSGGLDLQLLGIGANGHIGFNEPTSSLASRTRIKSLTEGTREANMRYFDNIKETPRFAITMGIATILEARRCIIVATGEAKSAAVSRMIEGAIGADCPATALQMHPDVTVVLDPQAAADLKLKEYYQLVHPDGLDVPFEAIRSQPTLH